MRDFLFERPPLFEGEGTGGGGGTGGSGGAGSGGTGTGTGAGGTGAGGGTAGTGTGGTGTGGAAAAWYDSAEGLAPEQRTFLAGKGYKTLPDAITSAMESDRLARDRNVLPKPDPQKLADWKGWEDLGWKADRAAYDVKKPQVPDGFLYDDGFAKNLVDVAHENRIPLPAAQKILDGVTKYVVDAVGRLDASGARQNQELDGRLRETWGQGYDANKEIASRAARFLGVGLDDSAELERTIGSARLMQLFHKVGSMLGEDKLVTSGGGAGGALSTSQVEAELARQAGDPEFMMAFRDPRHPRHADVTAQRQQLIARKAKLVA